jgi:hypothetical protein
MPSNERDKESSGDRFSEGVKRGLRGKIKGREWSAAYKHVQGLVWESYESSYTALMTSGDVTHRQ